MNSRGGIELTRMLERVHRNTKARAGNEGVLFESRGTVLVIGPATLAVPAAERLTKSLRVLACATGDVQQNDLRANPTIMAGRIGAVMGHLGRFSATALGNDGPGIDLGRFSPNEDGFFDLVLDLNTPPLLTMEVKPLGYFAPGPDLRSIDAAVAQLETLTGSFRKPRFFEYDAETCAHGAQGIGGCTRCLDVCPTGAIRSTGDSIAVDANLCQGCATCMLACPTGAIAYASPTRTEMHGRLAEILDAHAARKQPLPALLIHQEPDTDANANAYAASMATPPMLFAVPAIATAGMDLWFAALAQGAAQVAVLLPASLPASTRAEFRTQIDITQAVLAAIDEPAQRIVLVDGSAPLPYLAAECGAASPALPPATGDGAQRAMLNAALDQLQSNRRTRATSSGASIALPVPAPFGAVEVNRDSCTMCMACTNLCPAQALFPEQDGLRLSFVESRCVQCGICERGCPEKSIALRPRLLLDPLARRSACTLNEDLQHCCDECGTPFIGRALLNRSVQLLRDRSLVDDEGLHRLRLCPSCRARGMLEHG